MFVHISRAKRDGRILAEYPEFVHLTQTNSTRTYFHPVHPPPTVPGCLFADASLQKWAVLGQKIVETSFAIAAAEKKAFETLRDEVCTFLLPLPSRISTPPGHHPRGGYQTKCQGY